MLTFACHGNKVCKQKNDSSNSLKPVTSSKPGFHKNANYFTTCFLNLQAIPSPVIFKRQGVKNYLALAEKIYLCTRKRHYNRCYPVHLGNFFDRYFDVFSIPS